MRPLYLLSFLPLLASQARGQNDQGQNDQGQNYQGLDQGLTTDWDLTRENLEHLGILRKGKAAAQPPIGGPSNGPHCFTQKKSHFDESQKGQEFCQRYLIDTSHYKPGGPVIIQDNGESHYLGLASNFFQNGLLGLLAQQTNGIAVILEHRYYGESTPVPDYSTDNLRWLNNKEALEDSANFIRNFPTPDGIQLNATDALSPHKTPFIYMGGSYPGGRALFMRKHYPDLVWGAIGSSGVVHAQTDMPEWFGSIVEHADPKCVQGLSDMFLAIDRLLDAGDESNKAVKSYFGFDPAISNGLFVSYLSSSWAGYWQSRTWQSPEAWNAWGLWCSFIANATNDDALHVAALGDVPATFEVLKQQVNQTLLSNLAYGQNVTSLNIGDHPPPDDVSLNNQARVWRFQTCTEWGYYQGAPKDPNARRVVSKYATVDQWLKGCQQKFQPGEHFSIPAEPDVSKTNILGDYGIAADRLATIDGEFDPWRAMTVGAESQPKRDNTVQHPYWVIPKGAHCWDWHKYSNITTEPNDLRNVHQWEVDFVTAWVKQFHDENGQGDNNNSQG